MPMPPDVESYLRSLAHRFNEPDLREVANEIERLTAELAAKDKRIEELEQAEARLTRIIEKRESHLSTLLGNHRGGHIITTDQIDAAWNQAQEWAYTQPDCFEALACLNIVACEECGGSGVVREHERGYEDGVEDTCPSCNGHGWVVK